MRFCPSAAKNKFSNSSTEIYTSPELRLMLSTEVEHIWQKMSVLNTLKMLSSLAEYLNQQNISWRKFSTSPCETVPSPFRKLLWTICNEQNDVGKMPDEEVFFTSSLIIRLIALFTFGPCSNRSTDWEITHTQLQCADYCWSYSFDWIELKLKCIHGFITHKTESRTLNEGWSEAPTAPTMAIK